MQTVFARGAGNKIEAIRTTVVMRLTPSSVSSLFRLLRDHDGYRSFINLNSIPHRVSLTYKQENLRWRVALAEKARRVKGTNKQKPRQESCAEKFK